MHELSIWEKNLKNLREEIPAKDDPKKLNAVANAHLRKITKYF